MAHLQHSDTLRLLFDGADDPLVADPIPPEAKLFASERLSESLTVFVSREALAEIRQEASLLTTGSREW